MNMDKKFLMENSDGVIQSYLPNIQSTYISSNLYFNLIKLAITKAFHFYSDFFDIAILRPTRYTEKERQ